MSECVCCVSETVCVYVSACNIPGRQKELFIAIAMFFLVATMIGDLVHLAVLYSRKKTYVGVKRFFHGWKKKGG